MKKKRRIILIILLVIGLGAGGFYAYKFFTRSECQDLIDECCNKVYSVYAGGGMSITETGRGRTNIDDYCDEKCPKDCTRYTEERGYFKDKKKQQEYYDNRVKECKKKYNECMENSTGTSIFLCHECDRFGQPRFQWN